ncbi:MAG: hypothetical protein KGQ59_00210 [Bdellovibrionales bacterium]|nr:hypothetical protein [Bdellovibrionales bacterium]
MIVRCFCLIALLVASENSFARLPPPGPPEPASPAIEELATWFLVQGETRTLATENLERFSVSGKALRAAQMPSPAPPGTLLIKAVEPGIAEIWIWQNPGALLHLSVHVQAPPRLENSAPLHSFDRALESLREAKISRAGDRAILRGKVSTDQELSRIRLIENSFPKQVENLTELSPELLSLGFKRLSSWIAAEKLQNSLRLETLGEQLWVRGSASDATIKNAWELKLTSLFSGVRTDISSLPDTSRTLFFRVFFLEMKKNAFRQLGLDWPSTISGALQIQGGSLFWVQSPQIEVSLKWLEGKGWAKVLSQPELVVRVPGEAELFAGGEIPLELHSRGAHRNGSWIEWKPYGLLLKLKTLHSSAEQVRLEISSEISELDRANGSQNLPALQASRVKTQVDARIGEPLFLSGLLQEQSSTQQRSAPFLSRLPILGSLFGSEDFIQRRSELVAILVPLNAPPPAPSVGDLQDHGSIQREWSESTKKPPPSQHRQNWLSPYQERRF